jgi:hypothetical protein
MSDSEYPLLTFENLELKSPYIFRSRSFAIVVRRLLHVAVTSSHLDHLVEECMLWFPKQRNSLRISYAEGVIW